MQSIYEFVRQARDDYYSQRIEVVPDYGFSQHETLRTIELYHNSKLLSGIEDMPPTCGRASHRRPESRRTPLLRKELSTSGAVKAITG